MGSKIDTMSLQELTWQIEDFQKLTKVLEDMGASYNDAAGHAFKVIFNSNSAPSFIIPCEMKRLHEENPCKEKECPHNHANRCDLLHDLPSYGSLTVLTSNERVLVYSARALKAIDPSFDIHVFAKILYDLGREHGAMSDYLGTVGSWGDSLSDEDVAILMADFVRATLAEARSTISQKKPCHSDCSCKENQETPCPAQEGS